jgi:hypothetical protein
MMACGLLQFWIILVSFYASLGFLLMHMLRIKDSSRQKCQTRERLTLRINTLNKRNKRWEIRLPSSLSLRRAATIIESTATFSSKFVGLGCGSNSTITNSAVTTLMPSSSHFKDWVCQTQTKLLLSL